MTSPTVSETPAAELDRAVEDLTAGAKTWSALSLTERLALVKTTYASIESAAAEWAEAGIVAKGTPRGPLEGEEWMSGPYATLAGFGAIIDSLEKLAAGTSPLAGIKSGTAPGGRTTFRMLPSSLQEFTLFNGFTADLWLEPGISADQARAHAGLGANKPGVNGGVGLVLGAGNITAIGPLDVLYELIASNRASILKINPTFAGLIDAYATAFAPLIEANLLRVVNGGAETGGYLTQHPGICHVHITGSGVTHDAIVWGGGDKTGEPVLRTPITSELGGVSPIIVVPGTWSKADLRYQAEHVATQRLHNGGHNCIAGQALILSSDWAQREEFLAVLRDVLDTLPARAPWYPGTDRKLASAASSYPEAEQHGGRVLIEVNETTSQDLLTTEYFGPVLGFTSLPGTGIEFLRAAVDFANTKLDGTLGASLIVAPADRKRMGSAFDDAIADLHYGTIGINVWSAIGFLLPSVSWGAYPGNTLEAVGSGIGIVHNSHLVDNVERSVLTGPFRPFPRSVLNGEIALSPKPSWFVTARSAKSTAQKLTGYAAAPSWLEMPAIFAAAFRA
ncbi:aldehyde dehydrogenase family protein [Rhodococcus tibetensis]|uniref:Aldehyde dehydrogenase family protein n=1 Tax=Rhodococcus tibetensis TaxID=2965064 RepID=A0ABT1Q8S6_9NOCA|nr:aldehyde dehydrogenase family protein [Rhodococcus sp. FXJ9.536]MCQ4118140.1 aldehyde dehydrogenase family protein [Rhodococcus sp. FXJ9.536]